MYIELICTHKRHSLVTFVFFLKYGLICIFTEESWKSFKDDNKNNINWDLEVCASS